MDEATNEFDINSEEIILKNISKTYSDKTILQYHITVQLKIC